MAVRMAIGASAADVVWLVVGEGMRLSGIGVGTGLIAALAVTRVLKKLLFGVTPTDAWTFSAAALLLCVAAFFASYIPARRASQVDPTIALREQ